MSLDQAGTLHDPFGGQADLASRRVRFRGRGVQAHCRGLPAHPALFPLLRPLRWRPARRRAAAAAIAAGTHGLARLSAERVWSELKRILVTQQPIEAVTLMHRLGVLAAALPDACNTARLGRLLAAGAPPDPILRLAALLTGTAPQPLADRLRLSTAERELLQALTQPPTPHPGDDDATLRRLLGRHAARGADRPQSGLPAAPSPCADDSKTRGARCSRCKASTPSRSALNRDRWWVRRCGAYATGGCRAGALPMRRRAWRDWERCLATEERKQAVLF